MKLQQKDTLFPAWVMQGIFAMEKKFNPNK
jgi:hypothetical protein